MKRVLTISRRLDFNADQIIKELDATVERVRQSFREQGYVTHVDEDVVVCGNIYAQRVITAVKEDNDEID